jgi:hypothetical protein
MKKAANDIDVVAVVTSKGGIIADPIFVVASGIEVSPHTDPPLSSGNIFSQPPSLQY